MFYYVTYPNFALESFLMQYGESDWEFLRRVASMQGQPLIPEVRWAGARTYIGLMESGEVKTLEASEYRIRKTLAKIPGQADNVGRGYLCGNRELQVWDRYEEYEPGERVCVNGSILTVAEKTSYIKNSQWLNSYGFMESHACCTETIRTPRPSGVAVRGSVIEADMDRSRLRLVTDGFGESPESTHLCPVYYAGSGKGYSGQPEKGDIQYLYFPTGQDKDRYVIGSVDAGSEKMEQLDRQEGDENAGAETAGGELSEVKRWNTPGNRRMVLNRNGVSFADSRKGGLNVRSSGIRVWTDGNMALEAKEMAGDGRKITAEAGDYAWFGSGSSGMVLLPDQIHISAVDVYMESPLNWLHKTDEEESPETLLMKYEKKKGTVPPITAPDGSIIRRDGYDEILYSEEMYEYFSKNVLKKVKGYETDHEEPIPTLYEMWLDETYGRSKLGQFWDYCSDYDRIQTVIAIGGLAFDWLDIVNGVIYYLRGDKERAFWSFVTVGPIIGSKILAKNGKKVAAILGDMEAVLKSDDVVSDLILTYLAEERRLELLAEIGPLTEKMISNMRYSTSGLGIFEEILFKNLSITVKIVNNAGEVTDVWKVRKYSEAEIKSIIDNLQGDGFKNNPLRQAYENEVAGLKAYGEKLLASGMSEEQVARTLNQARRDLGIKYKNATPQPLRDYIYEINMGRYGDKLGPTYDWLVSEKGATNMDIINSSSRPNANIDKLLSGFEEWLRRQ